MREIPIFWPFALISVAVHSAFVAAFLLADPTTPPRPIGVTIGVTSFASSASRASQKKEAVVEWEKLPPPTSVEPEKKLLKDVEPKVTNAVEEIARTVPLPSVPPPPPTPPETKATGAQASIASQESTGAQSDVLPQRAPTNPAPPYPPEAERNGWEGRVVLRVMVLKDGRVGSVAVHKSSGRDALDHAARETVLKWQFVPGRRGGATVDAEVGVPIDFRLKTTP